MAATGKTPILLYGSTTPTNAPSAGNLTNSSDGCEIAINVADKNLFFKDATNTVNTVPIRQSSASSDGWLSSTDWSTFNGKQAALVSGTNIKTVNGTTLLGSGDLGTIAIGYGGTGLTSFTANQIHYGSFSQSSGLTFDGTNFATTGTATAKSFIPSSSTVPTNGLFLPAANTIGWATNSAQAMQISSTGGVSIGNTTDPGAGNLRFNTTGSNGIYFGSSSQLNDYETGTWTPASAVGSATSNSGRYTKTGNVVYISGSLTFPSQTNSGGVSITGLPYTSGATSKGACIVRYTNGSVGAFTIYVDDSNTTMGLYGYSGGAISYTQMSGVRLDFTGFYYSN